MIWESILSAEKKYFLLVYLENVDVEVEVEVKMTYEGLCNCMS